MADVPRLDFQHFLLRHLLRGNYLAPVPSQARNILDVGCGSGRWCYEMAQAFPNAKVIGMDLEEVTSERAKPENYVFQQANALHPLPFVEDCFDYVHMRLMLLSIPLPRWPQVLREIKRVTRASGWIELVECGCTIFPQGPHTQRWYASIRQACQVNQLDADLPGRLVQMARAAGLRQVQEYTYDAPLGDWAGRVGRTGMANMQGFYEAFTPRSTGHLPREQGGVDLVWQGLRNEWESMQARLRYHVVIGQKQEKGGQ